jgi:hypothetical protein
MDFDAIGKDLESALNNLGSTPEEVAAKLLEGGFKGGQAARDCPVANYLNTKIPHPSFHWQVRKATLFLTNERVGKVYTTPPVIKEFIKLYDDDLFLDLQLPKEKKDKEKE